MKQSILILMVGLFALPSCGQTNTKAQNTKTENKTNPMEFPIKKTEEEWSKQLSSEQ
jgi:hypothetical protein